jgi:hypothetical protein
MIELGMIRDLVAIFGVVAGFSYYVLTVRNSQRTQQLQLETRQAQLFTQLYNRFQSIEFHRQFNEIMEWEFKDLDEFLEKYGSEKNPEAFAMRGSVGAYFEGMGVLVKRGLIDVTITDDLVSGVIIRFWNQLGPIYIGLRERLNYPQFAEWTEYLYNQIRQIAEQQHPELKT